MAGSLGRLTVDLLLRAGAFESDLGRASKTAKKRMAEIEKSATQAGKVLGGALVAGAGLAAVAIKSAIDSADQLNEISKKVGIPTDVLSGLQYAAKLSGVATEELQNGLVKLAKFQLDAAQGGKDSTRIFEAFGIAVKDASGNLRASDQVFNDFADVFKALPDGPEKTALALKVFGKAGAELIPLLDEGRAGLKGYSDELKQLGGVVTPATAEAADQFNDNLDKLKVAAGGLALQVAQELLPDLIKLTDNFIDLTTNGDQVSDTAKDIADSLRTVGDAARILTGFLQAVVDTAQAATDVFIGLYAANSSFLKLQRGDLKGAKEDYLSALRQMQAAKDDFNETAVNLGLRNGPAPKGKTNRPGGPIEFIMPPSGSNAIRAARSLNSEAPDTGAKARKTETDSLTEAYQRMNAQMAETIALFGQTSEVAKVRYDLENGELSKLSKAQKDSLLQQAAQIDVLREGAEAAAKSAKARQDEADAATAHDKAIKALLDDIAFETKLTGLSNDERERAIVLRNANADAAKGETAAIIAGLDGLQAARKENGELIGNLDEFRGSFSNVVEGVLTGTESIGDAFKSLADQVISQIARIIAQNLSNSLLGAPGTTGAGTPGGSLLGSLFGSLFGGGGGSGIPGFATGTDFAPGGLAMVGERGPELVSLPRGAKVFPNGSMPGGVSVTNNINVSGSTSRETAEQIAHKVAMATSRAVARTA